jgi:hypothetical protein
MVGSIMLIYIWEFRSYGSGGELCCRNSPLSPPRCLARGSDPLGASSPWDLAPESLSPTGQGLGTAAAPVMSATDPRLRERHRRCPQCCGSLKCRPKPRPPAFPQPPPELEPLTGVPERPADPGLQIQAPGGELPGRDRQQAELPQLEEARQPSDATCCGMANPVRVNVANQQYATRARCMKS